jgi:ribose 5-phosphate isomerase B
MGKHLITAQTIQELLSGGLRTLAVPQGTLFTPLAAEMVLAKGIKVVNLAAGEMQPSATSSKTEPSSDSRVELRPASNLVAIGSDHGGFQLKESLKKYCESLGYRFLDVGTHSEEPCDYPDYAYAVAIAVAEGKAWRGVAIDGAGIGSCIVANKVPGIRAACCHNEFVARNAREHNDTNILTLGSRVVGSEVCKAITKVWLETLFAGGRHSQRVNKIVEVEQKFLK